MLGIDLGLDVMVRTMEMLGLGLWFGLVLS